MPIFTPYFEHSDFLVLDKPAGLNFHHQDGEAGLAQLAKTQFGDLWPVHRLDKLTSGLIIFAKSKEAAARFQILFSEHRIAKYYLALSHGKPKKKQGEIKGDMQKGRGGCWLLKRSQNNPAQTRFFSQVLHEGLRAYLLKPYTGKTHQLRVAMKSLGVPILGDSRYGGQISDRGYLDAFALCFEWQGEHIEMSRFPHQGANYQSLCSKVWCDWETPWALFPERRHSIIRMDEVK
ncbi:MAG: hypothetical protein CENE_02428 [Candidatus Celerinatantimonas neptuna]|nr:MAG: hypothetical protein CENE_02428 [Candidatus Celerinatantimonas neptuna]